MKTKRSLAFTVELLGLFILLILVIVIVTQVFVMSRSQSLDAGRLNEAVIIAQNTAEASSAAPELEDLAVIMNHMDNVISAECNDMTDEDDLTAVFDNDYLIMVDRSTENRQNGHYADDTISVYYKDPEMSGEPLYTLKSGHYFADDNKKD